VCKQPIRIDNRLWVCRRTPECAAERKRRESGNWTGAKLRAKVPFGPLPVCSFAGCGREGYRTSTPCLCVGHYQQERRLKTLRPLQRNRLTDAPWRPLWFLNAGGYWATNMPRPRGGHITILEHRLVMERILGRELLLFENVHHINGVRTDNRPENLELWVSSQPSGQRVPDLVEWAQQIVDLYAGGHGGGDSGGPPGDALAEFAEIAETMSTAVADVPVWD
jgi:hypothetical protein